MQTLTEIKAKLTAIKPILQEKYPLHRMAIFGSYARNEQTEESDIDIIVDVEVKIGIRFIDMANEIEEYLGIKTDVATFRGMKPRYFNLIKDDLVYV